MAARLPDGNEQNLQQFLSQSPWDWTPLWQRMAERIERAFPAPVAWMIDDTGFPKKGEHSVGVARQYSGTLGKTANCPVAVSLHAASATGSSPLGFRLYLPERWAADKARCRQAGVPDTIVFHKKWELALALVDQALSWGLAAPPVVLADAGYGDNGAFRQGLQKRHLPYAVGITRDVVVWTTPPAYTVPDGKGQGRPTTCVRYGEQKPRSVQAVAEENRQRFRQLTWREGAKGKLRSRFWAVRVQTAHHWQLGRRSQARWSGFWWSGPKGRTSPPSITSVICPQTGVSANW